MHQPGPSQTPIEKRNNWGTPEDWLERERFVLGTIDLDPASTWAHNERVKATRIYTEEDNGLVQHWDGNVHINPPYGGGLIHPFCEKMVAEWANKNVEAMIALTNSDTSTQWTRLLFESAFAVCFPYKRLAFIDEETGKPLLVWDKKAKKWKRGANNRPQAFWYWGSWAARFEHTFSKVGTVLWLPSAGLR